MCRQDKDLEVEERQIRREFKQTKNKIRAAHQNEKL